MTIAPVIKREILSSLLPVGLVVFFISLPHSGILLLVVFLIQLVWLPYSIVISMTKPQRRPLQLTRMAIWIGAVVVIATIHYVRHEVTRHNANEIVVAINSYTAQHGHCPSTTEDIGITREELREKLGYSYYRCKSGKQTLFYAVTYTVFDTYDYDFAKGEWTYRAS